MKSLATIATEEFRRRKASIDEAVAKGRFPRERGEANLRLWLSIALTAGAAPRDCAEPIAMWQDDYSDTLARMILLDDGPDRAAWHAELTRARDAAADKARRAPTDPAAQDRSVTLQILAIALGVCPEVPQMKEAA